MPVWSQWSHSKNTECLKMKRGLSKLYIEALKWLQFFFFLNMTYLLGDRESVCLQSSVLTFPPSHQRSWSVTDNATENALSGDSKTPVTENIIGKKKKKIGPLSVIISKNISRTAATRGHSSCFPVYFWFTTATQVSVSTALCHRLHQLWLMRAWYSLWWAKRRRNTAYFLL